MKTALIVLVALFAMAAAQGKRGQNGVHVVESSEPHPNIAPDFDSAYYRPSIPNAGGGSEPISTGPAFVDTGRPYQGKKYDNPNLRGGK